MDDVAGGIIGGIAEGVNALSNIGFGIYDRKFQREQYEYQQQLNQQAQANWDAQLTFQKEQFQQQKDNWNANRIGNLAKEYYNAGLNPALAAGLGQSTAGVVSAGGSAGTHQQKFGGGIVPEIKMNAYIQMKQLKMQEELNKADIEKAHAEAKKFEAEAKDIEDTKENRIKEIIARTGLTEAQAKEAIAMSNKLISDINLTDAEIENLNAETLYKKIETEILENTKPEKIELAKKELEKLEEEIKTIKSERVEDVSDEVRKWIDTIVSEIVKIGGLFIRKKKR